MTTHSETTLLGVIKRISFQSSDTGFTVASLSLADHSSHIIVGEMPGIHVGETLSCTGHWTTHPVHGPQFSVTQYSATLPTTLSGIESYLSSGVIKGIGPVFAKRIVGLFGSNTLDIIEEDPTQLRKVSGLGKAKCDKIIASLTSQRAFQKTLVFLHSLGLSTRMAQKVYQFYGDETVAIVSKNPYQLSQDVWGIGFVLADRIAKSCDISHESEERLKAGIRHVLSEKSLNGHTCFPEELLLEASSGLLSVSTDLVVLALKTLLEEGSVVSQTHRNVEMIFLASYYQYERGIISHLERLSSAEMGCSPFVSKDDDALMAMIHRLAQTHEISLSNSQTQALFATLTHKLMILTGKRKQQNKKIQAYRRGIRAVIIAGLYLTLTGWRVLVWRWKCPLGEID